MRKRTNRPQAERQRGRYVFSYDGFQYHPADNDYRYYLCGCYQGWRVGGGIKWPSTWGNGYHKRHYDRKWLLSDAALVEEAQLLQAITLPLAEELGLGY